MVRRLRVQVYGLLEVPELFLAVGLPTAQPPAQVRRQLRERQVNVQRLLGPLGEGQGAQGVEAGERVGSLANALGGQGGVRAPRAGVEFGAQGEVEGVPAQGRVEGARLAQRRADLGGGGVAVQGVDAGEVEGDAGALGLAGLTHGAFEHVEGRVVVAPASAAQACCQVVGTSIITPQNSAGEGGSRVRGHEGAEGGNGLFPRIQAVAGSGPDRGGGRAGDRAMAARFESGGSGRVQAGAAPLPDEDTTSDFAVPVPPATPAPTPPRQGLGTLKPTCDGGYAHAS